MDALSRVPPTPLAPSDASIDRVAGWFDVHYLRLSRLARRLTNSADDALDLVQETFLRASRHVSSVPRDPTGEEAWLVRTLVNIRRDQWRRMATRKQANSTTFERNWSPGCMSRVRLPRRAVAAHDVRPFVGIV